MSELTKITTLLGTGLVTGAVLFTVIGASAHSGEGDGKRHQRGEIVAETLGISVDDLKEAKEAGQTLEQIVTENGFDSIEAFEAAMEQALRDKLAERGLSEDEINEKIEAVQQRREIKADVRDARESLLGLTREEVKSKTDAGMSFEEILTDAGFEGKDAFHQALIDALSQTWADEGVDQETIDKRLELLERRAEKRAKHKHFHKHGGFDGHRG